MIFVKGAGRLRTCVVVGMIAYGTTWTATAQGERQSRHRTPAEFMSYRGAEWLERSERVHAAMLARGYDGEPRHLASPRLNVSAVIVAAALVLYGAAVQAAVRL